jgi:hypothetical protein
MKPVVCAERPDITVKADLLQRTQLRVSHLRKGYYHFKRTSSPCVTIRFWCFTVGLIPVCLPAPSLPRLSRRSTYPSPSGPISGSGQKNLQDSTTGDTLLSVPCAMLKDTFC